VGEEPEVSLVEQLGTSPRQLAMGEVDWVKTSVLLDSGDLPDMFPSVSYLLTRYRLTGSQWALDTARSILDLTVAVRGRGRADLIRGEQARRSLPVEPEPRLVSPSLWQRLRKAVRRRKTYEEEMKELGLQT